MNSEAKRKSWQQRYAVWETSGKTQRQWCEEAGYSYEQFKYWRKRVQAKNPSTSAPSHFQYVPVESLHLESPLTSRELAAVIHIGHLRIELKGQGGCAILQQLIQEERACLI